MCGCAHFGISVYGQGRFCGELCKREYQADAGRRGGQLGGRGKRKGMKGGERVAGYELSLNPEVVAELGRIGVEFALVFGDIFSG